MDDSRVIVLELGERWLRGGLAPSLVASGGRPQAAARSPPALRLALSGGLCRAPGLQRRLAEELALALRALLTRSLLVDASACRVVLCEPPHCPEALRGALARALLRGAGVASLAAAAAPACAALGCGAWTALVVALGERSVQCTPVVQGAPLLACAREWGCGAGALRALGMALVLGAAAATAAAAAAAAALAALVPAPAQRPARRDPLAFSLSPFGAHAPSRVRALPLATPGAAPYGAASVPWEPGQRDFELQQCGAQGCEAMDLPPTLPESGEAGDDGGEEALRGGGAVWAALDAWCETALRQHGAPVLLPLSLARALGCPCAQGVSALPLALPTDLWAALCSGQALLSPEVLGSVHCAALAALQQCSSGTSSSSASVPASMCSVAGIAARTLAAALDPAHAPTTTLAEAVARCLLEAPLDARRQLAACVVVGGGGADFAPALLASLKETVVGSRGSLRALAPLMAHLRVGGAPLSLAPAGSSSDSHFCATLLGGAVLAQALVQRGQLGAVSTTAAPEAPAPPVPASGAGAAAGAKSAVAAAATGARSVPSAAARLALLSKGLQGGRGGKP